MAAVWKPWQPSGPSFPYCFYGRSVFLCRKGDTTPSGGQPSVGCRYSLSLLKIIDDADNEEQPERVVSGCQDTE